MDESGQVAVRRRDGVDRGALPLADALERLAGEAGSRSLAPLLDAPTAG